MGYIFCRISFGGIMSCANIVYNKIDSFQDLFFAPVEKATDLRDVCLYKDKCKEGIWSRLLFIAQVVVSLVAIPLSFLAALLLSFPFSFFPGNIGPCHAAKMVFIYPLIHLSYIPSCLIAAFAPHSWEYLSPSKELIEWLFNP